MPTREEHLELARHHEDFISYLNPQNTPFLDWAIAASFWAALNYIDSVLALADLHPKRDRDRYQAIADHPRLADIISDYRELKYYYENAMGRGKQYKPYDYELTMAPHVRKIRGTVIRALSLWDKR